MEYLKENIDGILWLVVIIVFVFEMIAYLSWNRYYFTHGIPIFIRHIPINQPSLSVPSIEQIESSFPKSLWGNTFNFKKIAQNEYAFRDRMFELRWIGFSSPPVMHGHLLLENNQIVIKGYLIFSYPFFISWVGLFFDSTLALIILVVFFGIPYLLQLIRITAVAKKAPEIFTTKNPLGTATNR